MYAYLVAPFHYAGAFGLGWGRAFIRITWKNGAAGWLLIILAFGFMGLLGQGGLITMAIADVELPQPKV